MESTEITEKALARIIDYAQSDTGKGTILELSRRLSHRLGDTVHRQQVEKWLHPDLKKRVEPRLGIGILLMIEGARLLDGNPEKVTAFDLNRLIETKK